MRLFKSVQEAVLHKQNLFGDERAGGGRVTTVHSFLSAGASLCLKVQRPEERVSILQGCCQHFHLRTVRENPYVQLLCGH